ncbi:MAG: alpha/beta hydrolase [Acidimicrobiales bacterium]|nr:alpha/beta hydrolase [Acidimicrobiales bacterium]
MPSAEFLEFQQRMAAAPVPPPPASIQELRDRIEGAMGNLPLVDGTSAEDVDAGGVTTVLCTRDGGEADPWLVYFHGGGYRICSARAYRAHGSHLAAACKARVLLVDYRLAPEHPFPAAVDDAVQVYRWVLDQGVAPGRIVAGGDSAGGGLTAALLLAAKRDGLPVPAGGILLSGWLDLTNEADSYTRNAATDTMFPKSSAEEAAELYLQGHDPRDPLASPVFGDWSGMPPLLVLNGGIESLYDDSERITEIAVDAGVDVTHSVYDDMPHVWQTNYPAFPEAVAAVEEMAAFVARVTG